jgi:hypothetical protein
VYVVIRFWKPYTETGYTILIHGLIHILHYIRITIIYYTIIIMTIVSMSVGPSCVLNLRMPSESDKMLKEFYVSWTGIITISREYVESIHNSNHGVDHGYFAIRVLRASSLLIFCGAVLFGKSRTVQRVGKLSVRSTGHVCFLYDGHSRLIHVVVEVFITGEADAYKLLVCSISHFILITVECGDKVVPFG